MITTFSEYQAATMQIAIYPRVIRSPHSTVIVSHPVPLGSEQEQLPVYPALAALGEAGELAAKVIGGTRDMLPREAFLKELGDVLWYVTAAAVDLGFSLRDVASVHSDYDDLKSWQRMTSSCARRELEHNVCRLVAVLGLFSETVKKSWRDGNPIAAERDACAHRLAHALGLIHQLATCFYSDLAEVANLNVEKCRSRRARGAVGGSGDDR